MRSAHLRPPGPCGGANCQKVPLAVEKKKKKKKKKSKQQQVSSKLGWQWCVVAQVEQVLSFVVFPQDASLDSAMAEEMDAAAANDDY